MKRWIVRGLFIGVLLLCVGAAPKFIAEENWQEKLHRTMIKNNSG